MLFHMFFARVHYIFYFLIPKNVDIRDFRTSWSDGLAFCAIMHSFLPDKIPYDDLTPEDKRKNFTLAFEAAK